MKKHKIESLEEYIIREEFENPFDNKQIEIKPSHIADKGGLLKLRKEVFNINRVEYTKKASGGYSVIAKTQFAKGEIVEISPILFVGPEAKAVPRLKDFIYEIDKTKELYAIVLGYGSLYSHSETPNITFAYNPKTKQMYFISSKFISAGEELTIDYGKDYWMERSGFATMAEDNIQNQSNVINSNPIPVDSQNTLKQFSTPSNTSNPAISGVAIQSQV